MKILFVTINDEHANDSELNLRRGLMEGGFFWAWFFYNR